MAEFLQAYLVGRKREGGYSNVKTDSGGETYAGISRVHHPDCKIWPIVDSYKPLKWNQKIDNGELESIIKQFYNYEFWQKMKGDGIDSQAVATYLYDWFINSGAKAIMRLQEVLGVQQTGHFGDITLSRVNQEGDALLKPLHERRIKFYNDNVKLVPANKPNLPEWLDRANDLYDALS